MNGLLQLASTLILFLPAPHGLYVAADSRYDGGDPAVKDQARKIFLCGKRGVCAISGALVLHTNHDGQDFSFRVVDLLEKAASELPDAPPADQMEWLSQRMRDGLRPFFEEHFTRQRVNRPLSRLIGKSAVCDVLFVHLEPGGGASLYQMELRFRETLHPDGGWTHELGEPAVMTREPNNPLAQGATRCMRIQPDALPLTDTREQTVASLDALFARTQDGGYCAAIIGGPVDVAVVGSDGASWLRRKP